MKELKLTPMALARGQQLKTTTYQTETQTK